MEVSVSPWASLSAAVPFCRSMVTLAVEAL
jgi:hypothetical protein